MNVPTIESRVAALEAIVEQINHRLNSIDNRLNNMVLLTTVLRISRIESTATLSGQSAYWLQFFLPISERLSPSF